MGDDYFVNLAIAVVKQAMLDYETAIKKRDRELRKLEKIENGEEININLERKKGEDSHSYKMRKYRSSPRRIKKTITAQEEQILKCIDFFKKGGIVYELTDNGEALLEKCNENLRKQGYKEEKSDEFNPNWRKS